MEEEHLLVLVLTQWLLMSLLHKMLKSPSQRMLLGPGHHLWRTFQDKIPVRAGNALSPSVSCVFVLQGASSKVRLHGLGQDEEVLCRIAVFIWNFGIEHLDFTLFSCVPL